MSIDIKHWISFNWDIGYAFMRKQKNKNKKKKKKKKKQLAEGIQL